MNTEFSEENIKANCPFCDLNSHAYEYPLQETNFFSIICDAHPLTEGHILIVPKQHFSCIGEYTQEAYEEFLTIYQKVSGFIKEEYGHVSTFEHGVIGQTVFHSHVHLMPFSGTPEEIIPEGSSYLQNIASTDDLKNIYVKENKYLFFSIADKNWIVDTKLGVPRFFRDRFAIALGDSEKGNWKQMHENAQLMQEAKEDCQNLQSKWTNIKL